jgi:hypothetical protein
VLSSDPIGVAATAAVYVTPIGAVVPPSNHSLLKVIFVPFAGMSIDPTPAVIIPTAVIFDEYGLSPYKHVLLGTLIEFVSSVTVTPVGTYRQKLPDAAVSAICILAASLDAPLTPNDVTLTATG